MRPPVHIPPEAARRLCLLALALCAAPAMAVVTMPGVNSASTPPGASSWDHVGLVNGPGIVPGSGVYLGDRWVLTAGHVEGGNTNYIDPQGQYHLPVLTLPGQGSYTAIYGSAIRIGAADMTLFRLQTDPGLAPLRFGRSPALGSTFTFAGFGPSAGAARNWWLADPSNPATTTWNTSGSGWATLSGYGYDPNSDPATHPTRHWGNNVTVDADMDAATGSTPTVLYQSPIGDTWIFTARFDSNGITGEAQVSEGDSGGGVFQNNALVGVALYAWNWKNPSSSTFGQPKDAASFYNASSFADLFTYADEIASITKLPPGLMGDANLDGVVNKFDYSALIRNLGAGSRWSQGDFNLDGLVNLYDLQILERQIGATLPIASDIPALGDLPPGTVPEPAALLPAVLAWLALWRLRCPRRRRVSHN